MSPGRKYRHQIENRRGEQDPETKGPSAAMIAGRKRGVIFDVGHGGGKLQVVVRVAASESGLHPDSDFHHLHAGA